MVHQLRRVVGALQLLAVLPLLRHFLQFEQVPALKLVLVVLKAFASAQKGLLLVGHCDLALQRSRELAIRYSLLVSNLLHHAAVRCFLTRRRFLILRDDAHGGHHLLCLSVLSCSLQIQLVEQAFAPVLND